MAFEKGITIMELFLISIRMTFRELENQNLISVDKNKAEK